ncbi:hypothetical protein GCM10027285_27980 [Oleiagrimonas citrea]
MIDSSRTRTRLINAFRQENWPMVQHRAASLLQSTPEDPELHFMAGVAFLQMQHVPNAVDALSKAVELDAQRADYFAYYARSLALARRLPEACAAADEALSRDLQDARLLNMLGHVYMQAHAIASAVTAFERALARQESFAPFHFDLGYALAAQGEVKRAEQELEACIRLDPRHWAAHLSLSKLQRQTPESQHLERLQSLIRQHDRDLGAQIFLNMALGKEHEDLADYPQAFAHFARGKAAARSSRPASAERDKSMFDALVRAFPDRMESSREDGTAHAPIFIVGMPRTGTTLLDRILSSHPQVYSAGELQNFSTVLQRASGSPVALLSTPDIAATTRHIDWKQLGEDYIESTRPGTDAAPRFTDNMPHNFLYAGFIARALPQARILCLRRDPLDTCLGNFRQLFRLESGFYDYSLDLLDTGRYYIQFDRLMRHWNEVLPGRLLEVSYESLVEDPETEIRRTLAFCDLPWDEACLHSENNAAPVNTPNAWQVRAPIYTSAVGRWRRYAPQLGELRALLEDAGITLAD